MLPKTASIQQNNLEYTEISLEVTNGSFLQK